jgi:hypothetical protein
MNEQIHRASSNPSRTMSPHDFAMWGMEEVAFIKRVVVNDEVGWAIHRADGTHIGLAAAREVAFAAVRQYDLDPVSVH